MKICVGLQHIFSIIFLFLPDSGWTLLTHKDWLTLRTERAHILSKYKHLVTSSTLSWAWIEDIQSGKIPTSHLILVNGISAVCRVRDGNRRRAGRTDTSGSCLAGPGYTKHSEYQVLVDLSLFSRNEWVYWDMFSRPITGTLAYNDNTFVASFNLDTDKQIIGELDTKRGLNGNIRAYISEDKTKLSTQGSVLVEIEPTGYIIDDIKLNESKEKTTLNMEVLGELWLTREEDDPKDALFISPEDMENNDIKDDWDYVGARMDYTVKVAQYWGHVPGTIRGLSTVSKLFNSTEVRFPWGTHWKGDLEDGVDVGIDLQPGTKVLVKVQGVLKTGDTPYSATITQLYEDGVKKPVQIEGDLRHTSLTDIRVRYIDRQYIDTGKPAPSKPVTKVINNKQPKKDMLKSSRDNEGENIDDMSVPLGTPMSMVSNNSSQENDAGGKTTTELPATLYPPTVPTSAKPNPLRKFYPIEDESPPREKVMFSAAKFEHNSANKILGSESINILIYLTLGLFIFLK